jgi:hypothetical protein
MEAQSDRKNGSKRELLSLAENRQPAGTPRLFFRQIDYESVLSVFSVSYLGALGGSTWE